MAKVNSVNPVFVSFETVREDVDVTLKVGEADAVEQEGAAILKAVMVPGGAKMGFKDDGNVPFHDAFADVPWGDAILCKAVKTPAQEADNSDPENPIEAAPAKITLTQLQAGKITGCCYGTTIKDCSVQLNAGIAVSGEMSDTEVVPLASDAESLVVAVRSNVQLDPETGELVPVGQDMAVPEGSQAPAAKAAPQVLAISEAIDPTILQLGTGNTITFNIPKATGGFTFTVRGTLAKAPFVRHVSNYTSMKDKVSSYPTSQAILDAKISAGE